MLIGALVQTCLLVAAQETQIQLLREQLAATRDIFGASSEKKPRLPKAKDVMPDEAGALAAESAPSPRGKWLRVLMILRSSAFTLRWHLLCK